MLILVLIIISIMIFIPFYDYLGREWYGPYSLFYIPFLLCYIIAAYNADKWQFDLGIKTFLILLIGELAFLLGCVFAKKFSLKSAKKSGRLRIFRLEGDENIILTSHLSIVVMVEVIIFIVYLIMVYMWGVRHGASVVVAINKIMLNGKFEGDGDPLGLPNLLQIFLQMNYIAGYFFAYMLARRVILKDKSNIALLIIGYIVSILTNFMGGSRGPILELLAALLISIGITYYYKTNKRSFSVKQILKVVVIIAIVAIVFFEMLPLMGRSQTAADEGDVFTQYIGSQVYNLNYYVESVDFHSTFFCAETLKSFYADVESFFGLSIGYRDGMIGNSFVYTNNGHNLGNVFTTYYNFYIDFGTFGVFFFTFFMGWFSEKFFKSIKFNKNIVNIKLVLYIYMASSITFSFFASRFFQNVIQLKMLIKVFWLFLLYLYLPVNCHFSFKFGVSQNLTLNNKRKRID